MMQLQEMFKTGEWGDETIGKCLMHRHYELGLTHQHPYIMLGTMAQC